GAETLGLLAELQAEAVHVTRILAPLGRVSEIETDADAHRRSLPPTARGSPTARAVHDEARYSEGGPACGPTTGANFSAYASKRGCHSPGSPPASRSRQSSQPAALRAAVSGGSSSTSTRRVPRSSSESSNRSVSSPHV